MSDRSGRGSSVSSPAQRRYRTLLETVADGVVRLDADGHVREANDAFLALSGTDRETLCGESVSSLLVSGTLEDAFSRLRADPDDVYTLASPLRTSAGESVPCEWRLSALEADDGDGLAGAIAVVSERDDLQSELDDVFDRVTDAVYALDEEWRFTYLNDRAEELLGRSEADLLGENLWTTYPNPERRLQFERAMERQQPVSFEEYSGTIDAWIEARVYPSETGLSVYFRDITERKEREQALAESEQRYRTLAEHFPDGVVAMFDEDLRYTLVEGRAFDDLELDPDTMHGERPRDVFEPRVADALEEQFRAALEGETNAFELAFEDGEFDIRTVPVADASGDVFAGMVVARDVTERNAYERDLERRTRQGEAVATLGQLALETDDLEAVMDEANRLVTAVLDTDYCELLEFDPDANELSFRRGVGWREAVVASTTVPATADTRAGATLDSGEPTVADAESERRFAETARLAAHDVSSGISVAVGSAEEPWGVLATHDTDRRAFTDDDVTFVRGVATVLASAIDRARTDGKLREEQRLTERIVETSPIGITVVDADGELQFANDHVQEIFGRTEAEIRDLAYDDDEWEEVDADGDPLEDGDRPFPRIMASGEPVFDEVTGIRRPDGERVWISTNGAPLFDDDGDVDGVVFAIEDVTSRRERNRELEHKREQLEALNELNAVVREITDAILEQSTREEIEEIVCDRLAASDSYAFAWIGEVDPDTETVRLRTEAGVEGYTDDATISIDPDDDRCTGPAGSAVDSHALTVTRNVHEEFPDGRWRDRAIAYGFQSSAAIPIVHEGTLYGVLGVYADRPHAFAADERAVVGGLGEIVGHAIAAVERKRALMSDEVLELEIRIADAFDSIDVPDDDAAVSLDRTVPVGDGDYLQYGTTTEAGIAVLERICERRASWTDVAVVSEEFGTVRFEVRLSEPPLLSIVAAHGGSVAAATIDDEDLHLTIHLPQGGNARRVIEAIRAEEPAAEVLAHRQRTRASDPSERLGRAWADALTDRQRTALEVAYFSGYFEWPRESSGEDVAETLDVSAPTFHQHVRRAEQKLFAALLGRDDK